VHKKFISVSSVDEQGLVTVVGQAGAIESSSAVELKITNLSSNEFVYAQVNQDGSFQAQITAAATEKIQVLATNEERKKSRGTFRVPIAAAPPKITPVQSIAPTLTEPTVTDQREKGKEDNMKLAVVVIVIDKTSGEIITTQTSNIPPAASLSPENETFYSQLIQKIADQCVAAIRTAWQPIQLNPEVISLNTLTEKEENEPNEPREESSAEMAAETTP
jgi:hypothetical protein